jgi:hypothetical protein
MNEAKAMALVKKFQLNIRPDVQNPNGYALEEGWLVSDYAGNNEVFSANLNRAIVECVAKMQAERATDVSKRSASR